MVNKNSHIAYIKWSSLFRQLFQTNFSVFFSPPKNSPNLLVHKPTHAPINKYIAHQTLAMAKRGIMVFLLAFILGQNVADGIIVKSL